MFSGLVNGNGPISHGQYKVVAADDTAGTVDIATGLNSIDAFVVMVIRSGKVVASDVAVSVTGGTLTVADGTTFALTTNDYVHYIAIGK